MKSKNYKVILLFVAAVMVATISLQIYWNVKNFIQDKKRLVTEVQLALDTSVEKYYLDEIKALSSNNSKNNTVIIDELDSINEKKFNFNSKVKIVNAQNINLNEILDTIIPQHKTNSQNIENSKANIKIFTRNQKDVTNLNISDLTNKIFISLTNDSVNLRKIAKNLEKELARKKIAIPYKISQTNTIDNTSSYYPKKTTPLDFACVSKSSYLPQNTELKAQFSDPMLLLLKRGILEIGLSFLLSISVILCLFYLLKIINNQKKIDVIKNDLISNITHEFKTPITTISSALDGIKHFNAQNDVEKTNRYLDISNHQLQKLEKIVEKLLEIATLQSNQIELEKEETNLVEMIKPFVENLKIANAEKILIFHSNSMECVANVDIFHFENSINNLIDNALKYGGNEINVFLKNHPDTIEIIVEDNGKSIKKEHLENIFDQFYRIPKGNLHDVKGFGIGLYYAQQIIQKHNGTLQLNIKNNTQFIVKIPKK